MTKLGDLPSVGTLPSDAQLIIHSDSQLPPDRLIAAAAALRNYATLEGAETLKNKTFDSSNQFGTDVPPVAVSASSLKAGGGSSVTRFKYARAAIVIPSIANGAAASVTTPINGALTTDEVRVSLSNAFLDGIHVQARVTSADTVTTPERRWTSTCWCSGWPLSSARRNREARLLHVNDLGLRWYYFGEDSEVKCRLSLGGLLQRDLHSEY